MKIDIILLNDGVGSRGGTEQQQLQQSLIPLGEVDCMDHTMPFGTIKNQSFKNIIKSKISLDDFLQRPFQSPSSSFPGLKNMQSTLLIGAS